MSEVTVFAPAPTLTVTVEAHPAGDEIHVHAGGQGVWQARMLRRLGVDVTMCCTLTGESGTVLRHLLDDEGVAVAAVERDGRGPAYLHDRRSGDRVEIAEEVADPLGRHELDELCSATIREGSTAGIAILSGPDGDDVLPADTYRRLAADLRTAGARVIVDLSGERLAAAIDGGVDVLKVSDEELEADGLVDDDSRPAIMAAMRTLRDRGAAAVVVTRASEPLLALDDDGFLEVTPPQFEVVDTRGAGDSLTAGITAGLARGESFRAAVTLGAAAGALNVTRHGLGTGDGDTIGRLRELVTVRSIHDDRDGGEDEPAGRVSPDGLAALAEPDPSAASDGADGEPRS